MAQCSHSAHARCGDGSCGHSGATGLLVPSYRHAPCNALGVSNSVALLAEPDPALSDLMRRTLAAAGYDVFDTSNVFQVEMALRVRSVYRARNLLYVFASRLASNCAKGIAAASHERAILGLPEPQLILTYEFGAPTTNCQIGPCVPRGSLEKPFDLYELHALAFQCRDFLCETETHGDAV